MQKPLVSVIIPVYNTAPYIAETLESIIAQNYTFWECIVIDDHSTDTTAVNVKSYCEKYPELIKLYKNNGKGACAARNYGFQLSKGCYIQFLDGDDLLSANKIELQVKMLTDSDNKLSICETWHFNNSIEDAKNTDHHYLFSTEKPENFFIKLWGGDKLPPNMVQTSAWLIPRSLIEKYGGWNEALVKDQDGEFFARIGLNSNGIIYVPEIKNYYRKHIQGTNIASQKEKKHIESNLHATKLKADYLFSKNTGRGAYKAIATQFKHVAIEAWPLYKDITLEALGLSYKYGGSEYIPELGGRMVTYFQRIFGWKSAKWFSVYLHNPSLYFKK